MHKSNQTFYYTRHFTPKRVTSLRCLSPRHIANATQILAVANCLQRSTTTKSIKSNLHYTRLISFRVSRVSSVHLRGFATGPTHQGCKQWRVVGNVWLIWIFNDR